MLLATLKKGKNLEQAEIFLLDVSLKLFFEGYVSPKLTRAILHDQAPSSLKKKKSTVSLNESLVGLLVAIEAS
jgi:hypothetical protein